MGLRFIKEIRCPVHGQLGITGLETAIVLIAFVVVSSVFAFAALSSGMFATDRSSEVHIIGLNQTRTSMEMKGSLIGKANSVGTTGVITDLTFNVTQSAGGGELDLTPGTTIIIYTDEQQRKTFSSTSGFMATGVGDADSDLSLERNEVYEIRMSNLDTTGSGDDSLTYALGINKTFTLEVIPPRGSILHIERTTPIYMDLVNFLN